MSYKDETILDKIWNIRYSLIWVVWFLIGWFLAETTNKHFENDYAAAVPILLVMAAGLLFQKYKLLGED